MYSVKHNLPFLCICCICEVLCCNIVSGLILSVCSQQFQSNFSTLCTHVCMCVCSNVYSKLFHVRPVTQGDVYRAEPKDIPCIFQVHMRNVAYYILMVNIGIL